MRADIRRMWINQPSTHQVGHKLHGICVLADYSNGPTTTIDVYFLNGPVTSQQIKPSFLSPGWPEHLQEPEEDCEAGGYVPPETFDAAIKAMATKIDADLVAQYHKHFPRSQSNMNILITVCSRKIAQELVKWIRADRPPEWQDRLIYSTERGALMTEPITLPERLTWYQGYATGYMRRSKNYAN